jgi:hypothetical protein
MFKTLIRCTWAGLLAAATAARIVSPLLDLWRCVMPIKQTLTTLSPTDPRAAPLLSWDRSQKLQWVVVTATALGGPYTVSGDYKSLRRARAAATRLPATSFAYVVQVTLGNFYLYTGTLHAR